MILPDQSRWPTDRGTGRAPESAPWHRAGDYRGRAVSYSAEPPGRPERFEMRDAALMSGKTRDRTDGALD